MLMKILLIEDDLQIGEIITDSFEARSEGNAKVNTVCNGMDGLQEALENDYDLILLDVMLPGLDGFSIMRSLRKQKDVPVIFLTAREREEDILYGYELGCDDYVTKPFSPATLYAKSVALINRDKHIVCSHLLSCGEIEIDTRALKVAVSSEEIELPPIEYKLLMYLLEHKGWVIERETLLNCVWGNDYYGGTRVVDNHIKNLRKSLKGAGKQIKTVVTKGYKIDE